MLERGSLAASPMPMVGEEFRELVRVQNVVIEEIVSSAMPDTFEYWQPHDEWVVVLEGTAKLDVDSDVVALAAGEWVLIPAHTRHRVLETAAGTRWLAVHVHPVAQLPVR
ncbi:MAG TPA: cupin domain-containing protein [Acidimicrobiales bacterium]|nr:cupin domain-containing protein [Acidimicrobiales bacterium]